MSVKAKLFEKIDYNYYHRVHRWLIKTVGHAKFCNFCHAKNKKYEWALLKGKDYDFKEENFVQLCIPCHRKYDQTDDSRRRISTGNMINKPWLYKPIKSISPNGVVVSYKSIMEASKISCVLRTSISNCLSMKSMSAGGMKWEYINE
jgi:hypothetical protein